MPVSLLEWRVRIGRFVRNPPVINKLEMIKKFLDRWKLKKEKAAAGQPSTGDQTHCELAETEASNLAPTPSSTQTQTRSESTKKGKSKIAASPLSTQHETPCSCRLVEEEKTKVAFNPPCESAGKAKEKMASNQTSAQDQAPCKSAEKGKTKMAASEPSSQDQTPCHSSKKGNSEMAANKKFAQDQTSCLSAKKGKSKMAASPTSTQDQTPCQSAKKCNSKMEASQPSTQDETPCESVKKRKSKVAGSPLATQDKTPCESPRKDDPKMEASPLSTQDQTTCESAKKRKSEMAASPSSTQDQIPYKSARKRKSKMAASQPSTQYQIPCRSAKKGKSNMTGNPPSPQDKRLCESLRKDESKMEASPLSTQDQTTCESAKKDRLKTSASPPSLQDQIQSESAKEGRPKMAVCPPCTQDQTACESTKSDNSNLTASPPSTQDETICKSAKKGKSEMAASPPSTQTQTPHRAAKKGKSKMAASPPSTPHETPATCRLAEKEKTKVTFNPPCDSAGKGKENMSSNQTSAQDQAPCKSAKKGKSKMAANEPSTQDQTPCHPAKKGKSKMAASPTSTQDETPCKSTKKGKTNMAASPLLTRGKTPCQCAKKGKSKMAASPTSTQDETPCVCKSAMKGKSNMAGNPLSPQDETPCKSPRKDKSKMEAILPLTPNQTPCQPAKKGKSKMAASPPSTQDETPCESAKVGKSKVAGSVLPSQEETPSESPRKEESKMEASPPSTQDETPCESAKKGKSKMATSPPCESARKGKEKMASSPSYNHGQTSCEFAEADKSRKPASPPSSQDQTLCESSEKENAKMAASPPSTPHQALHVFESTEIEISKNAASQPSAQVQNPCQSTKRGNSRIGASPSSKFTEKEESNMADSLISTQDQTQCESSKKENTKRAVSPSSQNETPCDSEKKEKSKMAACSLPSTQDQAPCESAKKEKTKVATIQPSSQICQLKSPSCPENATLVWSLANTGSCVLSCIAQILLMLLTLMMACFQLCREQSTPSVLSQHDSPAETSQPPRMKEFVPTSSCFSFGMGFCRSMIACTVHEFCHLYLPLILLMRSGDVETNPGPNTLESPINEMEFLKLARDIHPSYYTVIGVSLGIPFAHLDAILIEKLNNYPSAFMAVFMEWNVKQPPNTNKREVLADALRENDLGDLSKRLQNGRLHVRPNIGGPSRPSESKTKPPPYESETKPLSPELIESTVSDMEFLKLARDIHPSSYTVLGVSLGIPYVHLEAILIEKLNNYPSAFMAVFMKWNVVQQPPNTNKREVLADKLQENDLGDLSEKLRNGRLLPIPLGGPSRPPESQTKPPPSESETKPLAPELIESTTVSEIEFLQLARDIHPSYYTVLGVSLGIPFAHLDAILTEKLNNYPRAFMAVFSKWNVKQQPPNTNKREVLADKLQENDLGNLSERLRNGRLLPNITVVTGNDPERIKAYEEALASGKVRCNRSRIMVVGPAGIGKTSLIRRLTGQPFNPAERSTVGTEHNTVNKNVVSGWKLDNDTNKDEVAECIVLHEQSEEQEKPSDSSATPLGTSHSAPSDAASQPDVKKSSSEDSPDKRKYIEKRKSLVQIQQEALPSFTEGGVPDIPQNVLERRSSSDHDSGGKQRKVIAEGLTKKRITSATSTANDISYSIWDFGGQVIYYITHPLFLSWRSLYIVVFPFHLDFNTEPPRTEEISIQGATPRTHRTILDLLHFWLMSIYVHAVPPRDRERFEPKILLVGTFRHEPSISEEDVKSKISQIKKMVQGKPYAEQVHKEILQIDNSSSSEKEVTYIQEQIDRLVKESAYMQEDLPIRWRTFSKNMRALKKDMVLLDEACRAMTDVGIIKDKEVELVLEFYHDTGDLIYHQGCELIVLNPQILNDFVSNIITVVDDEKLKGEFGNDWITLIEKGILTMKLLKAVWESNEGKADELKYLTDMMVRFDLICEIPKDFKLKTDILQGCHFVPCCSRPELHDVEQYDEDDKDDEFEFIIDFNKFLPDGFLHRLYVRMAMWSMKGPEIPYKPTFHCREMLFYIDEQHRVVMTNTIKGDDAHRIKVLILRLKPKDAPEKRAKCISLKRDFLTDLKDTLEDLKKTWARRISYALGLACKKCHDKGKKFSLVTLEAFLKCADSAHCGECNDAIYAGRVKQALLYSPARATEDASESRNDMEIEEKLNNLSANMPADKYISLCNKLGIGFNQASSILGKWKQDNIMATMECLMQWKNNGGNLASLKPILEGIGVLDLVQYIE